MNVIRALESLNNQAVTNAFFIFLAWTIPARRRIKCQKKMINPVRGATG